MFQDLALCDLGGEMDGIEHLVWFIPAVLVALAPLAMLADSLWRKREKNCYIVEIWNADHTRLLTTIIATDNDRLPGIGIVPLRGRPAGGPGDSPERTDAGEGNNRRSRERANQSHSFAVRAPMPHQPLSDGQRAEKSRWYSFIRWPSPPRVSARADLIV